MNKPDMFADPIGWEQDLVRRLTNKMADDSNRDQAIAEGRIPDAIRDTEQEVFWDSFDDSPAAPHAYTNHNRRFGGTDDLIDEMSQLEGIDGLPLSNAEGLAGAMQGDIDGYLGDRPLQHQHELDVDQENRILRDQLAQAERARQETINRYDPQAQVERQIQQQEFMERHGLMSFDDNKSNPLLRYMSELEQNRDQQNRHRINESMARAHEEYGRDFDATYTSLQQMDPNNPLTGQIMQSVLNSPDPGQSLMALHGNDVVASLGVGRYVAEPPFARTREAQRGPLRVDRVRRDEDDHYSGYGNADVEEAIFDSAMNEPRGYVNRGRGWEKE
jgi:hypothetical protein